MAMVFQIIWENDTLFLIQRQEIIFPFVLVITVKADEPQKLIA